jgi:hypothetical protein
VGETPTVIDEHDPRRFESINLHAFTGLPQAALK